MIISLPLISILGTEITKSITPIVSNIIARALTFFYTGLFVKLCSDT
jgi:hypothetical protein